MRRELQRGADITDKIMTGKAPWKILFATHTFFTNGYKYYLAVISASTTKEAQKVWSGKVESQVRHLVAKLEGHESISLAHPFNKTFERVHRCRTEDEIEKAKGGSLEYQFKEIPTETAELKNGSDGAVTLAKEEELDGKPETDANDHVTFVYTTTSYIGLELHEGKSSLDSGQCMVFHVVTVNPDTLLILRLWLI